MTEPPFLGDILGKIVSEETITLTPEEHELVTNAVRYWVKTRGWPEQFTTEMREDLTRILGI